MVRVLRSTPLQAIFTVLLPSPCRLCDTLLTELTSVPICSPCWNLLHAQSGALCSRCGEHLGSESSADSNTPNALCRVCRMAKPPFQHAVAWGVYQGELRELLHLLKYSRVEPLAPRLAELLAGQVLAVPGLPSSLLVVPVPLHRSRQRRRGFNQAEHLAHGLIRGMKRQQPQLRLDLAPKVLARSRATESQAGLSPHQRRANMRGAFSVTGKRAQRTIAGRHILLVDDIYTTGATARACSQALMRAGAASVYVATIARAQRYEALYGQIRSTAAETTVTQATAPELPMHEDVAFWGTVTTQNG